MKKSSLEVTEKKGREESSVKERGGGASSLTATHRQGEPFCFVLFFSSGVFQKSVKVQQSLLFLGHERQIHV